MVVSIKSGSGGARQEKHIEFDGRLDRLEDRLEDLHGLIIRVRSEATPELEKKPHHGGPSPSLANFLESGANRVSTFVEMLGKYTKELEEILF